eukprot:9482688-Pyramimonas_sp.AAC.1
MGRPIRSHTEEFLGGLFNRGKVHATTVLQGARAAALDNPDVQSQFLGNAARVDKFSANMQNAHRHSEGLTYVTSHHPDLLGPSKSRRLVNPRSQGLDSALGKVRYYASDLLGRYAILGQSGGEAVHGKGQFLAPPRNAEQHRTPW